MIDRIFSRRNDGSGLLTSQLYNEQTFYRAFERDLRCCAKEVVIESPFITVRRANLLRSTLQKLTAHGVRVVINTRHPQEHDERLELEAVESIALFQQLGVEVLFTGGHHRKLAILDRRVLYEGSLNILSQNDSSEIMRRIESKECAGRMLTFIGIEHFLDKSLM
jgi:phosphatidylserine/phosphatidylglycerophosphate/cardiolipin synthase-like enzyme